MSECSSSNSRVILFSLLTFFLLSGCGPAVQPRVETKHDSPPPCTNTENDHLIYEISVDGRDVGREVRSAYHLDGPVGKELLIVSHLTRRMRSGKLDYDRQTIRSELTHLTEGILLRASYVNLEHVAAKIAQVGFNGAGWDRVVEIRESVTDPISVSPNSLTLTGNEIIGYRLTSLMYKVATGAINYEEPVSYYDPSLDSSVTFTFSKPLPGQITSSNGMKAAGVWVAALRDGIERIRIFFGPSGNPLEEHYPALHQIRRLVDKPVSFPTETSDPIMGLFSRAYLGLPNIATYAEFKLTYAEVHDNDALSFLDEPVNQTLVADSENELTLKVTAGAPDGTTSPPTDKDLGSSLYIRPNDPEIKNALRYLRSGGKNGNLSKIRKQNATPVVARAALVTNPSSFWKDSHKVADLVMRYVYALLPDKHNTFSMANAIQTLENGAGDCTEHSVLFASLMRAQGIPTRLVAGIYLSHGGSWVYHMWACYWDGESWRPVDPGNAIFKPGALYVALGRGASEFSDLRSDVASFIDRSFSGVSFDLVSANAEGEPLLLATPRTIGRDSADHTMFNAAIAGSRGNYSKALEIFDQTPIPSKNLVRNTLFRLELLVKLERWKEALSTVETLRSKTSLATNLYLLDSQAFRSLVGLERFDEAEEILFRLCEKLEGDDPSFLVLKAHLLFERGARAEALELLVNGIEANPEDAQLLTKFISMVGKMIENVDDSVVNIALGYTREALAQTLFSKPDTLAAVARLLLATGNPSRASTLVDHGLVLAPFDKSLLALRDEIDSSKCK